MRLRELCPSAEARVKCYTSLQKLRIDKIRRTHALKSSRKISPMLANEAQKPLWQVVLTLEKIKPLLIQL